MKLLFAEDDRDLSRAVRTLLERSGYAVDVTGNGLDAVDYVEAGDYDGIILDWMMPGLDGIGVLQKLRDQGISTPCLMLTARDSVEDRVRGLDAGADDYLAKPFSTSELLARVRAMLRRRSVYVPDVIAFCDLQLDKSTMELRCGERSIRLNAKAFQLMEMLMTGMRNRVIRCFRFTSASPQSNIPLRITTTPGIPASASNTAVTTRCPGAGSGITCVLDIIWAAVFQTRQVGSHQL